MTRRGLFLLLLCCAAALLGCGKSTPPVPPPPGPPPPEPTPAPLPPKPPPPPGPRSLTFYHFGRGIDPPGIDYASMGVTPILVIGNQFWASPSAQADFDALCAQVRAAVPSGPVMMSIRSYSMNGTEDDLWQPDPTRWAALVQRARWLSAACVAHDVSGVFLDWEWDGGGMYRGKPVIDYPGGLDQCWQSLPGVDMAARGREFAAALCSARSDLLVGAYGPATGMLPEGWKGTPHPPPGWLPWMRAYFAAAPGPKRIIFEDYMILAPHAPQMAGYLATDLPGVPSAGGVNFSWLAAAGRVPVGAWSGAKYLDKFVAPAVKAPSSGAAFFSLAPSWSKGLDDGGTRSAIAANLAGVK